MSKNITFFDKFCGQFLVRKPCDKKEQGFRTRNCLSITGFVKEPNIIVLLFFLIGINQVSSQNAEPVVIGEKHILHSGILNEDREYWVGLPESYSNEASSYKRYPVLIVLDGSAHFRAVTGMVNYMSAGYNGNTRIPEMNTIGNITAHELNIGGDAPVHPVYAFSLTDARFCSYSPNAGSILRRGYNWGRR
ncbi:MAG: hypothetical protein J5I98_06370 [Phaeodactylibacter sp.]|nr:hypothetical protein [Phaeodactylibacter sp.]